MKLKNKIKKIVALFTMILLVLCGCKQPTTEITPTNLTVSSSEVKVIVNSIRDLNDIVTLRFEPKEATQRDVVWSAEENDVFTLEGSTLTAIKLGKAKVTATSVANNQLSTDVTINVYDPNAIAYTVTYEENEEYVISGLQNEYYEGEEVTFDRVLLVGGESTKVGAPYVEGASVVAKVEKQGKEKKVIVFKYKSKANYRRTTGHRQPYTCLTITAINA